MHLVKRPLITSTLVIGLVVAGCSDQTPVSPAVTHRSPSLNAAGGGSGRATGDHLVFFNGNTVPAGFAERVRGLRGSIDVAYDNVGIAVVSGLSEAAAAELALDAGVSSVDPDAEFQFLDEPAVMVTEAAADAVIQSPSAPQTAFFYPRQWHLRAIRADAAWAAGQRGSTGVRVAILDTGIDTRHVDLAGRVDLSKSASFVPSDDLLVAARFPGAHPSTDLHYHGTHVGATVSSNALAAAGVTSQTTLMAVKVLNVNGSGTTKGILAGIIFATDAGAHVINMSLGIDVLLDSKDKDVKALEKASHRAFQYAHSKGVLVVVAAGNEAADLDTKHTFKAYCSAAHVTCVSATGPTASGGVNGPWTNVDARAGYSNYGVRDVDVAAPGGTNAGPVWAACSRTSLQIPICQTGTFIVGLGGTSMASPHAAGVAALILAQDDHRNPGTVQSILENSADDLLPLGKDPVYGRGRINAARALGL